MMPSLIFFPLAVDGTNLRAASCVVVDNLSLFFFFLVRLLLHLSLIMATNNKYDRQLRLWGANGQKALGETVVVLFGASAAGSETVKNLILPGIGAVVVVDDQDRITPEDTAVNFFLSLNHSNNDSSNNSNSNNNNLPRAAVAASLLAELNPDVQVSHVYVPQGWDSITDWHSLWQQNKTINNINIINTKQFPRILMVASDLPPTVLKSLATDAQQHNTPLVIVETYGFIGYLRLQTPPAALLDPRPRTTRPDLRIANPFDTLREYCQSFNIAALQRQGDSRALGHVPYPVILWHALQIYQQQQPHAPRPQTFSEKQAFVQIVKQMASNYADQLNFQEAVANAYLAYTEIEADIGALCQEATAAGLTELLLLLQALQDFHTAHHALPVHGSVPDMTADTQSYVALQRLYQAQADADVAALTQFVTLRAQANNVPIPSADTITSFCQNLPNLQVWTARTWMQECDLNATVPQDVQDNLQMAVLEVDAPEEQEMLPLWWYLGIRACHLFYETHSRYPGTSATENDKGNDSAYLQADAQAVQTLWMAMVQRYGLTPPSTSDNFPAKLATEMVRYGAAELHNVAAILGGVAAQEVVKVVTGQYVPLKHTYVYNGIGSVGGVYEC